MPVTGRHWGLFGIEEWFKHVNDILYLYNITTLTLQIVKESKIKFYNLKKQEVVNSEVFPSKNSLHFPSCFDSPQTSHKLYRYYAKLPLPLHTIGKLIPHHFSLVRIADKEEVSSGRPAPALHLAQCSGLCSEPPTATPTASLAPGFSVLWSEGAIVRANSHPPSCFCLWSFT